MASTENHSTLVIAHRGASGYLPEHSLAAKALAHGMGADFLEQDVVLSRDGVPLVLHDITLETTTDVQLRFPTRKRPDGHYYAIDFDLAEIKQLRLHERGHLNDGNWTAVYPERFPVYSISESVPTLEEEIQFILGLNQSLNRRAGLYIELKAPDFHQQHGFDIATAVIQLLVKFDLADAKDQVILQCFNSRCLQYLSTELQVNLPLVQLIGDNSWHEDGNMDYLQMQSEAGLDEIARYADAIGPWLEQVLPVRSKPQAPYASELVHQAHARGLQVHPYTLRADDLPSCMHSFEETMTILASQLKVDGLFTDFPDLAVNFLRKLKGAPAAD